MEGGNGIDQRVVLSVILVGHQGEECRDDPYSISDGMMHNVKPGGNHRRICCCCFLLLLIPR